MVGGLRYVSIFSGIEAATVAWQPLGWEAIAFSEIDPFPCAVLDYRFTDVPNLGDIREIDWRDYRGATDLECERLQGFPDGWTDIPYNGKEHPPMGVRYKALGNSMAVPVMRWIGERIQRYEDACKKTS